MCVVWVAVLIASRLMPSRNAKKPCHFVFISRECEFAKCYATDASCNKKCTTDSTVDLLSSCHSSRANWWRNKLRYRRQRTDSRHRDLKCKSEFFKNKEPLHVSRKKELNDDVTCFKSKRKRLGQNELRNLFVCFFFLSRLGVNINGTAVIIGDYRLLWTQTSFLVQSSTENEFIFVLFLDVSYD